MKLTDQQLARFGNMVSEFAKKNGLTATMETDCLDMSRTDVHLSKNGQWQRYVVLWREVSSLTDAATRIFTDASIKFNLVKQSPVVYQFEIQRVLFNDPATIVFWKDGTKTVVKCQDGDVYSEEVGLALCFAKKALGNQSNFNNVFKKWVPEAKEDADSPVVFTLPELAPCDQMAAQNAIKQLVANKTPSAAEIMAEFKRHMRAQRGATDEV